MPISEPMNQIIMTNGNALDIAQRAKKKEICDLCESGWLDRNQGVISLDEIEAFTNV